MIQKKTKKELKRGRHLHTQIIILNTDGTNPSNRPYICASKTAKFQQDNRQCSIILFPITGIINNTSEISEYSITISAGAPNSDDTLSISTWNMTIQEVQN